MFKQILKQKHIVDEYHLWVNTNVEEDLDYINKFAEENSDFVTLKYGCDELDPNQMGRAHNVKRFYNYCLEPDTFYYKVDDDIIFIEDGTFEKLAQYKLDNPETFLLYPTIINNYWCTHFLRKHDAIDVPECVVCDKTWYPDFEKARDSITEMISTGMDAVQGIMRVAEAGDSPRAYEVASLLLKTVTEMNKDLIDIHKKAKDAEKENVTIKNTTNNSIYVGSTTDLQNLINKSRSQYKDLPEAEVIDSEDDDGEQSVQ